MDVPDSLRRWFVAHFVVDVAFAVPLLLVPERLLGLLGWACVDPVSPRLVGAALMGIGVQSLLGRHDEAAAFRAMLRLKVIWSASAVFALVAGIGQGAPPAAWAFLAVFIGFSGVWQYYLIRMKQLAVASN